MVSQIQSGNLGGKRSVGFFVTDGRVGTDTGGIGGLGSNRRGGLNLGEVPQLGNINEDESPTGGDFGLNGSPLASGGGSNRGNGGGSDLDDVDFEASWKNDDNPDPDNKPNYY